MSGIKTSTSLAVKYRPQRFSDVVEQDTIKQILSEQLATGQLKRVLLFTGPAGCGKAQPLYSKILTPSGFTTMGEIKVGDEVYTDKGNITKVSEIYPQGKRAIYEITLQDNTKIRVADNHLNCVYRYNQDKRKREDFVWNTLELIEHFNKQRFKLRMDVPKVNFANKPVLIDPYLMGALLGDGCLSGPNVSFSNCEKDIVDKINSIVNRDYGMYLRRIRSNKGDYAIQYIDNPGHNGTRGDKGSDELKNNYDKLTTLRGQLDHYNLRCKSVDKHIPKDYLINDYNTRLSLLQGLYDTDGHKGGRSFTTSSKQLSEDIAFLARSLGIRVTCTQSNSKYNDKECNTCYKLHLKPPKSMRIFTSIKHIDNYMEQQQDPIRNIESIEYIGEEECQCIMVEHEDHTYISDDFIPTHNTTNGRIFANEIEPVKANIIEINAADHTGVEDVRSIIENCKTKPLYGTYKVFIIDEVHSLSVNAFNALLKLLEEPPSYCVFIMCTTDPQKIIGTILSRAYRYDFQKISHQGIVNRLNYILESEKSEGENGCGVQSWTLDALNYIAKVANGGMRDAVTLLDKCLSYSKNLTIDDVVKVLGVTSYDIQFDILDAMINHKEQELTIKLDELYKSGKDLKLFTKNFLSFILDVNKFITLKSFDYISIPSTYQGRLNTYNEGNKQYLKYLLVKLMELNTNMKWEVNPRTLLESSFLLEVL